MAAITAVKDAAPHPNGLTVIRFSGTSTANQADTLTSAVVNQGGTQRLCYAYAKYSGAPTQNGVTVEIDSGLGSGFDATLSTGVANATSTFYCPECDVYILPGDAIRVSAPAGGGSLTSSLVIVLEQA